MTEQMAFLEFAGFLRWIDGAPLLIEPYRQQIFTQAFPTDGERPYNLVLAGRAKKNAKTLDLVLAALYKLLAVESPGGNQCYILANDADQAGDDLSLAKRIIKANAELARHLKVLQSRIERLDGKGFLEVLPAQDVAGAHGKTYCFVGFDEIHAYRDWGILESLQLDPTRPDALMWITTYATIYHRPGVPLFDLCQTGWAKRDPRMLFSWYAADRTTDPDFTDADPETRANPSRGAWADQGYLDQQRLRLPAHKFRRLHLNLPGLPEGSAFQPEPVMEAVARGVSSRPPDPALTYSAFVDMSGGSSDDAVIAIGHRDPDGKAVIDVLTNQGGSPPFDPRAAVARFAGLLKKYGVSRVRGDRFAGNTFVADFQSHGIAYEPSTRTASQLYEALEPHLNAHEVVFLDVPLLEQQLLGLRWRSSKIDHAPGEHDDWANGAAGLVHLLLDGIEGLQIYSCAVTVEKPELDEVVWTPMAELDSVFRGSWR